MQMTDLYPRASIIHNCDDNSKVIVLIKHCEKIPSNFDS